jgi:hypothetical protein
MATRSARRIRQRQARSAAAAATARRPPRTRRCSSWVRCALLRRARVCVRVCVRRVRACAAERDGSANAKRARALSQHRSAACCRQRARRLAGACAHALRCLHRHAPHALAFDSHAHRNLSSSRVLGGARSPRGSAVASRHRRRDVLPHASRNADPDDPPNGAAGSFDARRSFSEAQRRELRAAFAARTYIKGGDRRALATRVGLTEQQVTCWFRYQRWKTGTSTCVPCIFSLFGRAAQGAAHGLRGVRLPACGSAARAGDAAGHDLATSGTLVLRPPMQPAKGAARSASGRGATARGPAAAGVYQRRHEQRRRCRG